MNPNAERRRALELLAGAAQGSTETIMFAHGFKVELLVDLVRSGLATGEPEIVHAGRQPIEVVSARILPAGRPVLAVRSRALGPERGAEANYVRARHKPQSQSPAETPQITANPPHIS
jgi:hypothetical protein